MFNILVTGGLGFIGSNFINLLGEKRLFRQGLMNIWNLDKGTYAANPENIFPWIDESSNYQLIYGDIADKDHVERAFELAKPHLVVHFAAESHVDNSISDATPFIQTNIVGTQNLLEAALKHKVVRFVHVSTDEVYGHLEEGQDPFTEETPLSPRSPYSASKASSDLLAMAWRDTHGLPVVITRCSNNYGAEQHAEKFIPKVIEKALRGEKIPVYGSGDNIRDWIYVKDHCEGIYAAMLRGKNEVYNFGGGQERRNIEVVKTILQILKKDESLIEFVDDRKGHDYRYAINYEKAKRELRWEPSGCLEEDLVPLILLKKIQLGLP